MAKHWVYLPNRERIRIHLHWHGLVVLSFEPYSHPNQVQVLKRIAPLGAEDTVFALLKGLGKAYDHAEAPYSFDFSGHQLRVDATMEPYALFGVIPMPRSLVEAVRVTLWVDGARYREFVF